MHLKRRLKEVDLLFLLKTGIGSAIAILIASRLGLAYSASAGIITLLTIQNTKKETIYIALRRVAAFMVAVAIAFVIFFSFGYTSIAFGIFVFLFVAACHILGLQDGVAMNAVLTTHFLIEQTMAISFIFNEVYILLIGMSIGIGLNLIMPRYNERLKQEQAMIEENIKRVLKEIAAVLRGGQEEIQVSQLKLNLARLLDKAYEEADNRFLADTKYLISYLEMRCTQVKVLENIKEDTSQLGSVLPQAHLVADYIEKVAESFHETNDAIGLVRDLEALYRKFKKAPLPESREAFENRAILFLILKEIQYFLEIKREFSHKLRK